METMRIKPGRDEEKWHVVGERLHRYRVTVEIPVTTTVGRAREKEPQCHVVIFIEFKSR